MKKLLLLVLGLISVNVLAQNTYVPDDNFEQALIDLGYDTVPLDDYVPTTNISSVTNLDISAKSIEDLTGIEDFSALKILNVADNKLTELNITNNIALESLYVYNNLLSALDVTKNTNLDYLFAYGNYNISAIDVSNNPKLAYFNLGNSKIKGVDISNNPQLKYLYLQATELESINLTNNPNLLDVWLSNTKIESVDFSNCNLLQGVQLQNCTSLKNVNIKNGANENIVIFKSQNTPKLFCIQVDDTVYSVANWKDIDTVNNGFNQDCIIKTYVPDDNFEQALIDLGYDTAPLDDYVPTANIQSVEVLNIKGKRIEDLTGLEEFVSLKDLNISRNQYTQVDLSKNVLLEKLYVRETIFTTIDLTNNVYLKEFDGYYSDVKNFDFSNNLNLKKIAIYEAEMESLNIANCLAIESLAIQDNKLQTVDFSKNINLKALNIANNKVTSLDLTNNTKLTVLNISNNTMLTSVNLTNTNNTNVTYYKSFFTPNLNCIQVDNAAYSTTNWTNIDAANTFSENCTTASVDNLSLTDFSIYPNPANEYLTVATNEDVKKVVIYNMQGAEVFTSKTKAINTSILTSGVYLIKVITKDNKVGVKRLIKKVY